MDLAPLSIEHWKGVVGEDANCFAQRRWRYAPMPKPRCGLFFYLSHFDTL